MAAPRRFRLSTDARRQQLVALGIEIFSERPFDEVSIDDIAAAAGISKGLLYHYFPSKRDFYVAVVRFAAGEMEALTEPDPELAPLERLGAALDPAVAAIVEDVRQAMTARLLADVPGAGAGDPPAAVRVAIRGWLGFVEAASLDWLDHGGLDRAELRDMLVATLTGALGTAGAGDAARSAQPVAT
jgi:AcrR family transcriptional regulator